MTPDHPGSFEGGELKLGYVGFSSSSVGLSMASFPMAMVLGPMNVFKALNTEIDISVDRPVLEAVDMDGPLDHLSGIVDPIFEGEVDPAALIFVEVGLTHQSSSK